MTWTGLMSEIMLSFMIVNDTDNISLFRVEYSVKNLI